VHTQVKANRPEKTFGDLLNQREDAGFVGREGELNDFRIIINNPNPPRPLINVYGIGGIGKTALLRQYVRIARGHKIPTGVIDIRVQRGNIFEIIEDLRKQLELESGSDAAFREYAAALKRLYSIETKIERLSTGSKTSNLLNLAAEGIADSTSNVTSTIAGGIAGSVAGPIGTILGAGLGAAGGKRLGGLLTETAITNLIRRGLSADDARFIIGLEDELTTTFANALNEITTAAGRLLLVIDTYEEISPAVDEWFRDDLLTKLRTQIIIIVAGRDSLVTQEPQWYRYSSLISQKEIHRFTTQDAIRYLMIRGVTDQTLANRLIEFTEGLPWALALICDINDERIGIPGTVIDLDIDQHVVGDRVIARFLSQISGTELAIVLNVCAIARRFDRDLLSFVIGEVATAAHVNRLQRYSFVRLLQGGQMALHDIVRNFMSNRLKTLDPTYYRSTHLKLHEYYNTKLAVTGSNLARADVIECIYHAFNADENMGLDVFTEFFSRLDVYR
jgi:hypothetical protein